MKTDTIMDAIGKIDLKYVQEAEEYRAENGSAGRRSHGSYRKVLSIAACLALILGAGAYGLRYDRNAGAGAGGVPEEGSVDRTGALVYDSAAKEDSAAESAVQKESGEDSGAEAFREEENVMETGTGGAQIYVNEITEVARTCYDIAGPVRTEYYSADALEDYYGTKLMPQTLPEDLRMSVRLSETEKSSIYQEDAAADAGEITDAAANAGMAADLAENTDVPAEALPAGAAEESVTEFAVGYDGEGNVVDDNNRLCWQNADGTRSLVIAAHTVPAGEVVSFSQKDLRYSSIAGHEVILTHFTDAQEADNYLASYVKNGVTVTVESCGMTQEELLDVLEELLAEDDSHNRAE